MYIYHLGQPLKRYRDRTVRIGLLELEQTEYGCCFDLGSSKTISYDDSADRSKGWMMAKISYICKWPVKGAEGGFCG